MTAQLDYDFAVFRVALTVAGLALFAWGIRARRRGEPPRARRLRLGLLAAAAATAYGSYFFFYQTGRLHLEDAFHYYVGAKYSPELGYYGLYDCALRALDEAGRVGPDDLLRVRNLATMQREPVAAARARGAACQAAFSPARWRAFAADVAWFHERTGALRWRHVMEDHGYHPSPVWTLFGRPAATWIPVSTHARLLTLVDHGLVLATLLAVGLAAGLETACLLAILWGTGFLWRYGWIGDAFLRHLWFASAFAGLALLRRGARASGAALLVTSALLRVFPAVLILGFALHALRETVRARALPAGAVRFAAGGALAAALLVAASVPVAGRGVGIYREFAAKIARFSEHGAVNKVGLGVVTRTWAHRLGAPPPDAPDARPGAVGWTFRVLRVAVVALGLAGFAWAVGRAEDWEAAALGATLVPLLTEPTNYYYSISLAAVFLAIRRPRIGVLLFLACIAWSVNGLVDYQRYAEFLGASLIAVVLSFAILREMLRPPEPAPA
jgi:hypothetical protein